MSYTRLYQSTRSDAELVTAVEAGDESAIEEIIRTHRPMAMKVAKVLVDPTTAEDVVAESMEKLLRSIQAGAGPTKAIRPYLAAIVRNTATDHLRRRRELPTEIDDNFTQPAPDPTSDLDDKFLVRSAFESLPDRWQSVLWLTCVEDADRDDVGRQLGIRPGAVSQLALRAREGLRQAYLAQYVRSSSLECERVANRLPAYIRKRTRSGESARIEEHLDGCESCAKVRVELRELNLHLGATLAVAIVGTAAAVSLVRAPAAAVAAEPRWRTNRTVRNVAVGSVVMSGIIATGAIAASINAPQQGNSAGQAVAQGAGTQAPAASDPTAATSPSQSVPTGTESTVPEASTFPVPAPSATSAAPTAGATKPAPKTTTPHPVPSLVPPTSAPKPDAFTVANPVLAASGNGTYQTRLTLPVSATRIGTRLTAALWFSGTAAAQLVGGGWRCTSSSGGSLGGTVMECKTTTTQPSADLEMLLDAALPQDFEATVRNDDSAESHAVSATLTA